MCCEVNSCANSISLFIMASNIFLCSSKDSFSLFGEEIEIIRKWQILFFIGC